MRSRSKCTGKRTPDRMAGVLIAIDSRAVLRFIDQIFKPFNGVGFATGHCLAVNARPNPCTRLLDAAVHSTRRAHE